MKVLALGKVENGVLVLNNRKKLANNVKAFNGKNIILTIERKSKKRSNALNRYYWGVVIDISVNAFRNLGNAVTADQVHEIFKFKFLRTSIVNFDTGEVLEYTKSTSELSNTEFMDYFASIQQYMAETFDTYIPDPNELLEAA